MNRQQIRKKLLAILNRNDCTDDLANDFIDMSQSRIERTLRVPGMEKISIVTGNATPATESIVIPQDFLSLKHLYSGSTLLVYKDLGTFLKYPQVVGIPQYYTRVGASYLVKPTVPEGDTVYMVYYASQAELTADTSTNFFTTVGADVLIYAALCFAADYFVDDRLATFEARYSSLYAELEEQGRMTDMEQSAMAMQPAYDTEF